MTGSISDSQKGGEVAFRGLDYQKKFIAYLSTEMLLTKPRIKRITCEHLSDIEVEEDSKLVYYQVKSTTKNTLSKSKVIDGIKSFSLIDSNKKKDSANEYIIVSSANIANISKFNDILVKHPLDDEMKNEIESLEGIVVRNRLLERIYLMKGPVLEEISSIITSNLFRALKDKNNQYDYTSIKDDLLHYVNRICPGPIDLEDKRIIYEEQKEDYYLNYKTITIETINKIIENNPKKILTPVLYSELTSIYNIMPSHADNKTIEKIHQLIDEYNNFAPEEGELRFTYMCKFNEFTRRFSLYKYTRFLDFLKQQFNKTSNNKHIISECLFILHNLILTSKVENESSFIEYVNQEYFPLLKENLESVDERYEYSFLRIEEIIDELKDSISTEQLCEIYWKRTVNIIRKIKETGKTDNRLWNCISKLDTNKCKIKIEWRRWLIKKDEYSDIKNAVLKELQVSAFL